MQTHPIVEAIKKERQNETAEQTRARALRYVERMKAMAPTDDAPLTKATTASPPSERDRECSRCHEMKAVEEMAKKDAKTLRSYCKKCDSSRVLSRPDTEPLTKATTTSPPLSEDADWQGRVARHRVALRKRQAALAKTYAPLTGEFDLFKTACSAEHKMPVGQAAGWLREVPVYRETRRVAQQIARLCGDDSEVATTFRSIADAAQLRRDVSDDAIAELIASGWLSIEPTRTGTLFQLCVGNTDNNTNNSQEETK